MPNDQDTKKYLQSIKKSIDLLIMVELFSTGATVDQVHGVMGKVDKNLLSRINSATSRSGQKR